MRAEVGFGHRGTDPRRCFTDNTKELSGCLNKASILGLKCTMFEVGDYAHTVNRATQISKPHRAGDGNNHSIMCPQGDPACQLLRLLVEHIK